MKNQNNGNEDFFRPQVHRSLREPLKELSNKSHVEMRMLITAALANFIDARKKLLSELENKIGE